MSTTTRQIQTAVRDVILGVHRSADATPIVRQTTLAADATTAQTGVSLTSLAGWAVGSQVAFADTLGEETLYVANGWAGTNPVPLDFTNLGYTGLKQTHPAGTTVYTNLFAFTAFIEQAMLLQGDPVIFVRVTRAPWKARAMPRVTSGTFFTSIYYERILVPPGEESGQRMPRNNWVERQELALRDDIDDIIAALIANQELIGASYPARALQMAPLNQAGDLCTAEYDTVWVKETQTWHFGATISAIYAGAFQ